jgi:hypothetical protein
MSARPNALRVVQEYGTLAFGSVTGSLVAVLTTTKHPAGLLVSSFLNGATSGLELAINGNPVMQFAGTPQAPFFLPVAMNGFTFAPGAIAVRHLGVAPTSGTISIASFPMR